MASTGITEEERDKLKQLFVDYYEDLPVIKYAAFYVGVTEQTAHNWLNEDEDFFSLVNQAKARWAKKRALKTKAEFQLERLDKEIFREQRDIVTDGDPIRPALVVFMDEDRSTDDSQNTE